MNFFERQDKARALSFRLFVLFILAALLTILAVHALVALVLVFCGDTESEADFLESYIGFLTSPSWLVIDCTVVGLMILIASCTKLGEIESAGIEGVAQSIGAVPVSRGSQSILERRLYNVVEEMAISSGTPVPRVYIMPDESSINACAFGSSPDAAAVCVTRGALELLTRDELQGVVAHEFSHIVNNDVRLNMRLIGVLFGIELLSVIAYAILSSMSDVNTVRIQAAVSRRNSKDEKGGSALAAYLLVMLFAFILLCIGLIGVFVGNIIRAAISRQREYLADASAVQFTRNPGGIAGALKKIGCANVGSALETPGSEQTSHMFFGSVFGDDFWRELYRTHPDLVSRIRAIEPSFDGVFPTEVKPLTVEQLSEMAPSRGSVGFSSSGAYASVSSASPVPSMPVFVSNLSNIPPRTANSSGASSSGASASESHREKKASSASEPKPKRVAVPKREREPVRVPQASATSSGTVDAASLYGDWAKASTRPGGAVTVEPRLLEPIPTALDDILVNVSGARATLFATLFSRDPVVRSKQNAIFRTEPLEVRELTAHVCRIIQPLSETTRLQAVRIATPLLRNMSVAEYRQFRQNVIMFCAADGKLDLFEYTLQNVTLRELDVWFRLSKPAVPRVSRVSAITGRLSTVLVCLACEGEKKAGDAIKAYVAGFSVVKQSATFPGKNEYSLNAFAEALNDLAHATPTLKQLVLEACWKCILYDGVVTERESALLSAVTAALGAPAPVWKEWSAAS